MRLTIKTLQSMQMTSMQAAGRPATSRKRRARAGSASSFSLALLATAIFGFAGAVNAQVVHVYLEAQPSSIVLDGVTGTVPTWVFVCDPDEVSNANCVESGPGAPQPTIVANAGEDLVIHLNNELRSGTPVSVMIPGQAAQAADTVLPAGSLQSDSLGRDRVRSFTKQTGFNGTRNYRWNNLKPGTYLYQSATQPSLQVPMGLFGAVVVEGYGTTPAPVDDVILLFSEIDPVQNQRVHDQSGAARPSCVPLHEFQQNATNNDYPCTIDYHPTHVLINGGGAPVETTAAVGDIVQLRLLNAGLRTHNPAFVGMDMTLIAEDGNLYPGNPRVQSHALLPAGKTLDALVTIPSDDARFNLFDRMPTLSADGVTGGSSAGGGGTLLSLTVGNPPAPTSASTATISVDVPEDTTTLIDPPGQNALTLLTMPANGTLVELPGTTPTPSGFLEYEYTPNQDFSGTDGFAFYRAGNQTTYIVTLNVGFENDAPVAADDAYVNTVGGSITVPAPGVLANDIDVDGDTLTAVLDPADVSGVTLNPDGSFSYTGSSTTFEYTAVDDTPGSTPSPATVTLTVNPMSEITLTVEDPDGTPVTAYRWLVQEDTAFQNDPDNPPASLLDSQSLNFHRSQMPVVAQGCVGMTGTVSNCLDWELDPGTGELVAVPAPDFPLSEAALDPNKRYYVSVLPSDAGTGTGHTIGGAQIPPMADRDPSGVTVIVNDQEVPTAQISVLVFEDNAPTNGVPEPDEPRLGGFQIILEDAGGRYGISGGTMSQDAFAAPLTNALPCAPSAASGVILTCPDGNALIQNLPPGKYGVIVVPPIGEQGSWTQTSTIEGTKVIDAWVKAGEPPYFLEFGGPGPHAFVGFVNPANTTVPPACTGEDGAGNPVPAGCIPPGPTHSITGRITTFHDPRPNPPVIPGTIDSDSYVSLSHTRPWIGLNSGAGGGPNWATVQADVDDAGNATFTIDGVPDGSYELVVWDDYLDQILASRIVDVAGGSVDTQNIPVFHWFGRTEHNVFLDDGCGGTVPEGVEDGIRQDCEAPLSVQALNLRWRDGTVNQSFPTDLEGFVPFDQTFPFFSWQVLEVDYTRFKATGMTVTVDAGGIDGDGDGIDDGDPAGLYSGLLNSQEQGLCTQDDVDNGTNGCTVVGGPYTNPYQRTETGQILTQGVQIFPGQTSIFDWGKAPYAPGENGGISGIVFYGSTRGENDPRLTVGDPWEPGIPGVKVRLYREVAREDGGTALALVQEVTTDSWDDSIPTGCPGEDETSDFASVTLNNDVERCYDGWRNWNQARPAVFDGGYAFNDIPAGKYIVEVEPPPGYELIKEEDVNVGFGDAFGATVGSGFAPVPVVLPNGMLVIVAPDQAMVGAAMAEPGIAQPPCVGEYHTVAPELSLFPGMEAPFAGADRRLCDRKEVFLSDQGQAAADFHLFTTTPVAAQFTGLITDDISNEFNPLSPGAGEKWNPAYLPFAIRDFNGRQVYRGYSDAFGRYNGVLPSTFTANIPIPSGYSPAMMLACLNDPGDDPEPDPYRLNNYGNACYTGQFMPGTTTYLDTPILPTAAFAGGFSPVDCAPPQDTPVIRRVNGNSGGEVGPWINVAQATKRLTILSEGFGNEVPNPRYEGPTAAPPFNQPTITRNFGFGTEIGTVTVGDVTLDVEEWANGRIRAVFPAGAGQGELEGQLVVTRGDNGASSTNAVTVTISDTAPDYVAAGGSIQDAIDSATPGSLIIVGPGVYDERLIMWKPVRLQGSGSETVINATKRLTQSLTPWLDKIQGLLDQGEIELLPGQPVGGGLGLVGANTPLTTEQGAGVTVVARNSGPNRFRLYPSRIDGFTITGAASGGGIFVNGYAHNLEISNNSITGNSGFLHGGIRLGHPNLVLEGDGPFQFNNNVNIHHNSITSNGATGEMATGGGVSLSTGSNNYTVAENFVCGNYTAGDGAGIGHYGQSRNGKIENNRIVFNQAWNVSLVRSGGGIFVGGEPPEFPLVNGAPPEVLTLGSGNVNIIGNLIQGNTAQGGHGGGIRTHLINGRDVANNPNQRSRWFRVRIVNNMIVNNVAGWAGGGISLQDAVRGIIQNNTIANNDSTATVGALLVNGQSEAQPAGISSEPLSPALEGLLGTGFAQPQSFINNIISKNRSFHYDGAVLQPIVNSTSIGECGSNALYWDLGVLGQDLGVIYPQSEQLDPRRSLLTSTAGFHGSNSTGDPDFLNEYCNGARQLSAGGGPIQVIAAFGEGGNFLDVRYGPLTHAWPANSGAWDYHIDPVNVAPNIVSAAVDRTFGGPDDDIDAQIRPASSASDRVVDIGADEVTPGPGGGGGPTPGTVEATSANSGTLAGGVLDFGDQTLFSTSTVTFTVGGETPVAFGNAGLTSTNTRFGISFFSMLTAWDTCAGQTLTAGQSCTVSVLFRFGWGVEDDAPANGVLTVPYTTGGTPNSTTLLLTGQ